RRCWSGPLRRFNVVRPETLYRNRGNAMLTLRNHLDLARHKVGGNPDSRIDLVQLFNRAGRSLTTAHDWNWRSRGPVVLTGNTGDDFLVLPEDYRAARECFIDNTAGASGT